MSIPDHDQPESDQTVDAEAKELAFEEFLVDEAGMETFPASDPPSWTPLGIAGHSHNRPAPAEPLPQPTEPPSSTK